MPQRVKKLDFKCKRCGTGFQKYQSQIIKPGDGGYCSRKCRDEANRNGSMLSCVMCDGMFYRYLSEQDIGEKVNQFCSKACYKDWRIVSRKKTTYPKLNSRHEHRVIAEQCLGRELEPGEVVHHIDHNKHNNAPNNLAVFPSQALHAKCHKGAVSKKEMRKYLLVNLARKV